jgi:hypothetical protein
MPNARASLLVRCIFQNHGELSARKRQQFPELSDEEVAGIEESIRAKDTGMDDENK